MKTQEPKKAWNPNPNKRLKQRPDVHMDLRETKSGLSFYRNLNLSMGLLSALGSFSILTPKLPISHSFRSNSHCSLQELPPIALLGYPMFTPCLVSLARVFETAV